MNVATEHFPIPVTLRPGFGAVGSSRHALGEQSQSQVGDDAVLDQVLFAEVIRRALHEIGPWK